MLINLYSMDLQIGISHHKHAAFCESIGDHRCAIAMALSLKNATDHS